MKIKRYRILRRLIFSSGIILLLLGILWLTIPRCELYREDLTWSPVLRDRDGKVLHLGLAKDDRYRVRVPIDQVSPTMRRATLAYEDEHYFSHPGVNPLSMARAVLGRFQGVSRGGGSTISMQYARLRFQLKTRSITGKLQQMLCAIQLEKYYTKEQILEAYFNTVPYGGNVEGVSAASVLWCGKESDELELAESVALVMLPQRPALRRPRSGVDELPDTIAARNRLLEKLRKTDSMLADYRWEPVPVPREMPHLARRMRESKSESSIDSNLQTIVEKTVRDYLVRVEEKGVGNAAVMVVDAPTREVLAYVGSGGFFNNEIEGQIDGLRVKRSPGSLYKPFIFGLGIEQGLLHPNTLLADAPMRFNDYNPENNERDFLGPVKAREALYRSRNLPALKLMQQLDGKGLYGFLKNSGLRMDHPAGHYGLALGLGAAPATPEEIAMLYAALADDGQTRPLVFERGATSTAPKQSQILSEGTRWLVRYMMADSAQREPFSQPTISYKTGTSQGYRDAWAIGISGRTVILVWIGNFDTRPNPSFQGLTMAAPLMHQLFSRTGLAEPLPAASGSVKQVQMCAVSGMIPSEHCKHRCDGHFLSGVSPIMPCDLHRLIWVDQRTGLRVAPRDGDSNITPQIHEFWSPEYLELFRLAGLPRRAIPQSADMIALSNDAPKIISPLGGHLYQISSNTSGLICKAKAAAGVNRLFWFGNGVFLGSTAATEAFVWNDADGLSEIHVMDDRGMSASTKVQVER
ncbi:MAG: penicillin-binding protein 1C [Akkermansiaceae bacterium]